MPKITDFVHLRSVNQYEADDWVTVEECHPFLVSKVNGDASLQGGRFNPTGSLTWEVDVAQGSDVGTWHEPATCPWGN